MDWSDFLAVQGTLKSLPQHHSSKASILWHSAFFIAQLSHLYVTSGKTIALTRQTFVGKVMSLIFNMLSRLVIVFLSRSKCLLISWLQLPSIVILEPKKIKCLTVSIVSPSICHEVMGSDAMTLVFWMFSFKPRNLEKTAREPLNISFKGLHPHGLVTSFFFFFWPSYFLKATTPNISTVGFRISSHEFCNNIHIHSMTFILSVARVWQKGWVPPFYLPECYFPFRKSRLDRRRLSEAV